MVTEAFEDKTNVVNYDDWRSIYSQAWSHGQLIPSRAGCSAPRSFSGWIQSRRVRDLHLVRYDSMPFGGTCGGSASEYVGVQVTSSRCGETVQFRGWDSPRIINSPVGVWDGRSLQNFQMIGPGEYFTVLLPRVAIEHRVGSGFALDAPIIQSDSALVRVLGNLAKSLCHEFPTMQAWEFDAVSTAFVELIASLGREVDEQGSAVVSDTMYRAVSRWIDESLLDGQINSGRVAREHGISVRSLHRLFERDGKSFSAVVRSRRLSRALEDLAATNLSITYLASKWGYADTSHFCRELRRVHDMTPGEYRRASQTVPASLGDDA